MGFHTVQKVIAAQHGLSRRALVTLLVLAHKTDDATGQCWPSRRAISFSAAQSLRTTTRALAQLAEAGVLLISRRASGVRRNLYTIDTGWLDMQSVRGCSRARKPLPPAVQKPVEKFWESCGRRLKKLVAPSATGANSGTSYSYKEALSKNEKEVETRAMATSFEHQLPLPDLSGLLSRLAVAWHGRLCIPDPMPSTTTP